MIAASIVTYHVYLDELDTCLACLESPEISDIYIVDNASEERVRLHVANRPKVHYIPSENRGFGAGHNIAIQKSLYNGADYHLVLNSDVMFKPDILSELRKFMDCNPEAGMVQPMITNPDGSLQYTVRQLPTPFDVFIRRFVPASWFVKSRNKYLLKDLDHSKIFNVPYHQGSFMFIRCEALRSCGLFDERFFMYPEDIDITRRIHRKWQTPYYPGVSIVHNHRAASYKNWRMTRIHAINMIRYFNKWGWFWDSERTKFNKNIR